MATDRIQELPGMSKAWFLSLLLWLFTSPGYGQQSEIDTYVIGLCERPVREADITKIPAEQRPLVIERLREIEAGRIDRLGTVKVGPRTAAKLLIRLGDEAFIKSFMEGFRMVRGQVGLYDMFTETAQPLLIPYLVECVATKDFKGDIVDDIAYASLSGISSSLISGIVASSDSFSEEARGTLAKPNWGVESVTLRQVPIDRILAWWSANEAHFRERNYKAVTPISRLFPVSLAVPLGTPNEQKALLIFTFIKNVEWKHAAKRRQDIPFIIGVHGDDALADLVSETSKKTPVKDRVATVRKITKIQEVAECHVLMVGIANHSRTRQILSEARREGVLTVGESANFLESGGVIQFIQGQPADGVGYKINVGNAVRDGLHIDGFLLRNELQY